MIATDAPNVLPTEEEEPIEEEEPEEEKKKSMNHLFF